MRMEVLELVRTIQIIPTNIPIYQTTNQNCNDYYNTHYRNSLSSSITICSEGVYYKGFGLLSRFSQTFLYYNFFDCVHVHKQDQKITLAHTFQLLPNKLPNKNGKQASFVFDGIMQVHDTEVINAVHISQQMLLFRVRLLL